MTTPNDDKQSDDDVIDDVTTAAVAYLVDHFPMLPADKGRIAAFFTDVVSGAIESAILLDRQKRHLPSDN